MFDKILIANRGEIACRIARTCRKMAIAAATVHSTADADALHVRDVGESIEVGDGPARDSYLNIERILEAAARVGADAIHPGVGFLSESAAFATAVENAGLVFIGPTFETLRCFADKASAKQEAIKAGLPVVPGSQGQSDDPAEILKMTKAIGLPVLLKAAGGGGGRGLRVVDSVETFDSDIEAALREAESAFQSAGLIVEKYMSNIRHIEVQIAGDGTGQVVHLYERECSLQRRHQKVIEEAPAENLPVSLRAALFDDAVKIGRQANYRGVGTVEFIVDGEDYYFLEINPRLQVEHPVTEKVTGLDLVELQIRIASGAGLPIDQDDVTLSGHAMEARIYAEDVAAGFVPSTGRLRHMSMPRGEVRVDVGVAAGDTISPYYDSMIAKLITHGGDRDEALARLQSAVERTEISGVTTNSGFLSWLLALPEVHEAAVHTRLIDDRLSEYSGAMQPPPVEHLAAAAYLWIMRKRLPGSPNPWQRSEFFTGWRMGVGRSEPTPIPAVVLGSVLQMPVRCSGIDAEGGMVVRVGEQELTFEMKEIGPDRHQMTSQGRTLIITGRADIDHVSIASPLGKDDFAARPYLAEAAAGEVASDDVAAPMMGSVLKVLVTTGQELTMGQTMAVLESMKMEIPVNAPADAIVAAISCEPGDMVERNQILFVLDKVPGSGADE